MSVFKYSTTPLAALAVLAACSGDSNGPGASGRQIAFQLATSERTAAPGMASVVGPETIGVGTDTIVFTSVQLVLREIELDHVGGTVCDTTASDDCEELEIGPILLDLPLGAGADRQFTVAIDTGSYDKIQFEVHKPESSDDAGFIALHPEFDGVSIKATGTWNGTPFTYTSDLDVEQEYSISPPLVVTETSGANVTLRVDLAGWFLNQAADGLIDPMTANKGGQLEGEVKSNIEASLNAFEDDDHDGADDSTDDD